MGDYAELPDQFSTAIGFQVEITGAAGPATTDGAWKAVRGGGLRFNEGDGVTVGGNQFKDASHGLREWDDVTLIGPVTKTRKDMMKWYLDTVKGEDHRRNLSIIILGRDGQETHRYNYLDCFLTGYSMTPLDSDDDASLCEETVTICVARSDNYLK